MLTLNEFFSKNTEGSFPALEKDPSVFFEKNALN